MSSEAFEKVAVRVLFSWLPFGKGALCELFLLNVAFFKKIFKLFDIFSIAVDNLYLWREKWKLGL